MANRLEVDVDVQVDGLNQLDDAAQGVDRIHESTSKLGAVGTGVFQGIGQAIAGVGIGLAKAGIDAAMDAIGDSISLASDKAEAASKVNVLFGDSASIVQRASEGAATAVGVSSGKYLELAGTVGNLVTNLGFAG